MNATDKIFAARQVVFRAPWGTALIVMTALCSMICIVCAVSGIMVGLGMTHNLTGWGLNIIPAWTGWLFCVVPLLGMFLSAFYTVRGYVLDGRSLLVLRLGWSTPLDLSHLSSAAFDPEAVSGSIRLFGNAGFFSFTGWFRNSKLGVYRAFATDSSKSVILRIAGKTIVITPDDPQKFVAEINEMISHET